MHFESDTKFHSKRFPEIHLRNGYEAVEYKTLRRVSRYIGSNPHIAGESDS
jgi:ribosomal protein S18